MTNPNNSSTGGPVLPDSEFKFLGSTGITFVGDGPIQWVGYNTWPYNTALEDDTLDDFFQSLIVGVTGLPGNMVFPRWQTTPPNLPPYGTNWGAVGVTPDTTVDDYPYLKHYDDGFFAFDLMLRHENIEVLCSFYGPNAKQYASYVRDGMYLPQNREPLQLAGMDLTQAGPNLVRAPEEIKNQVTNRWDVTLYIKRCIQRRYAILSLVSVTGILYCNISNDTGSGVVTDTINATIP